MIGFEVRGRARFTAGLVCAAAASALACEQGLNLGVSEVVESVELPSEMATDGQPLTAVAADEAADPGLTQNWQAALGDAGQSVTSSGVALGANGTVFLAGSIEGALEGQTQLGGRDAFLAAYSTAGEPLWVRQLGTAEADSAAGVASDAESNVFVAGSTAGALDGGAAGFGDGFLAKYAADGNVLWTRQLGSAAPDAATGVSVAPSGVSTVVGHTRGSLGGKTRSGTDADAFVAQYSAAGALLWVQQLGSEPGYDDIAQGVSVSAEGAIYVAGRTFGALDGEAAGSADAFLAKYSGEGELLWVRQLGAADFDAAEAVVADAGGDVYIGGQAGGFLAGGPGTVVAAQPFVARYTAAGDRVWEQQFEAANMGAATSLASDGQTLFVAGYTSAAFGGPALGAYDAFLASVSLETGESLEAIQPGVADSDRASGVAIDGAGRVVLSQHATSVAAERFDYTFVTQFR